MKDGALAIFVKTAGLSPVKTRLAAAIGEGRAAEFYQRAVDVAGEVAEGFAAACPNVAVYWAVAERTGLDHYTRFPSIFQGEGGLGERMERVYNALLGAHRFAILIGSDIPTLTIRTLAEAERIVRISARRYVLGPASDGGFYLVGGNAPIASSIWNGTLYSSCDTCQQFRRKLPGGVMLLAQLSDVDTVRDLFELHAALSRQNGGGLALRNLAGWLSKEVAALAPAESDHWARPI